MSLITLTTDFGSSEYAGAVKGVILSLNPEAKIVDITHGVRPFNIRQAAYILYSTLPYFPHGCIHLAVVDPGVGTERRGLMLEGENYYLVGPDNGVFSLLDYTKAYEIEFEGASRTFHGRDVFAPAAARLSLGTVPKKLGREVDKIERLEVFRAKIEGGTLSARVLHVDSFGNIITDAGREMFERLAGNKFKVKLEKGGLEARYLPAYGYAREGELILLIGSSGMLELSQNRDRASETLNISPGDRLEIEALR